MPGSRVDGVSSYLSARWQRLNGPERIAGVDLARGLAVIGMFAAHLLVIADVWLWSDAATWLHVVDGRSSILFATLAGVSIGLVTGGEVPAASARMAVVRRRLVVRAGILWVLGVLLVLTGVPVYVILPAYAILFLLTLPFVSLGSRALLIIALALGLLMPFVQPLLDGLPLWHSPVGPDLDAVLGWHYPFPVWIAFLLAGLAVTRAGIRSRWVQWRMLAFGAAAAVLGYGLTAFGDPADPYLQAVWTAAPHSSGVGRSSAPAASRSPCSARASCCARGRVAQDSPRSAGSRFPCGPPGRCR
ncbi:heparan-alpha-glucosaminide N-acetyltransferase domain-containing protein [Microbacterium sp. NIBRBAC000506063]|uniref:heparan-alpha-glucosaminide N-acetyltransferase domain-containing protein n=1 Tax=Microbacterium sp. NIBRBAC000506063 TaxID=2734618 RepID=UPI001CB6ED91|nr:heparan-alpha-glucosaminide N-acetyltransferase domain-containing protein [Microbacterium sp. NIBRBAC000506063]